MATTTAPPRGQKRTRTRTTVTEEIPVSEDTFYEPRPSFFRRVWNFTKKAAAWVAAGLAVGVVASTNTVRSGAAWVGSNIVTAWTWALGAAATAWNWAWPAMGTAATWVGHTFMRIPHAIRFVALLPFRIISASALWSVIAILLIAVLVIVAAGFAVSWWARGHDWFFSRASRRADARYQAEDATGTTVSGDVVTETTEDGNLRTTTTVTETVVEEPIATPPNTVQVTTNLADSKGKRRVQKMSVASFDAIGREGIEHPAFNPRTLLNVVSEQELADRLLAPDEGQSLYEHIHENIAQRGDQFLAYRTILEFLDSGDKFNAVQYSKWYGRFRALRDFDIEGAEKFFERDMASKTQTVKQRVDREKKGGEKELVNLRQVPFGEGFREEYRHLASTHADPRTTV